MKKKPAQTTAPDFTATCAFVGIDVSKDYFDAALCLADGRQRTQMVCERFANDGKGVKAFDKWIVKCGVSTALRPQLLIVMENTGLYHRPLWKYASEAELRIVIANGADVKWSMGIARGKNDRIDAIRICDYAFEKADKLVSAPKLNDTILTLKDLYALRLRLKNDLKAHQVAIKELQASNAKKTQTLMERVSKAAINGIKKSLEQTEAEILVIIKADKELRSSYELLLSVPGIGFVTAVYLICCTVNFIMKPSGKQLACYAGVVPFTHESGTSVKSKARVHKMANKELKKLLHMGARSITVHTGEAKAYYDRKAAEGKHDLSIINAIKNKMLLRVAAVIREGRPYVDKSAKAA